MTPALLDRPASLFAERAAGGGSATAERLGDGRVTLEERLNAALHATRTNGSTECPVCHARMTPTSASMAPMSAGPARDGAECGGCGSQLT